MPAVSIYFKNTGTPHPAIDQNADSFELWRKSILERARQQITDEATKDTEELNEALECETIESDQ